MTLSVEPLTGLPLFHPGDNLAAALAGALRRLAAPPADGDILVVCQKVVSKVEGRYVDLRAVEPSALARRIAAETADKDPRAVEVVLRESNRIVRMKSGHLIVETGPGWVCANAGIDASNTGSPDRLLLLPLDPDASAARLAEQLSRDFGIALAVIISDTWGRPWRVGLVDFAIGVAGMSPLRDHRGEHDLDGRELQHTIIASADALAAAAGLVMGKSAAVPAALVRGYSAPPGGGSGRDLLRDPETDLFR
jgi:coenzyme F420-0:L-glutamate ligase/coenzyme F420-1:gamma-L-glutamate ligase